MIHEFLDYLEPRLHKFINRVKKSPAMEIPGPFSAIVMANILIAVDMLLTARLHEAIDLNPGTVARAVGSYVIGFIVADRLFMARRNISPLSPQFPPEA